MRTTSPKEFEAVLKLDGRARYKHFVKRVADEEQAWGLWDDEWAMMTDDAGTPVFPLWPAKEYAAACATGDWQRYRPGGIALDVLLDELLPRLKEDVVVPGIFPTPQGSGVTLTADDLQNALRSYIAEWY